MLCDFTQALIIIKNLWEITCDVFLCTEAVTWRCSVENVSLKILQNSQENTCARISFLISWWPEAGSFIKKESLAQVFSYEFCEMFKKTFFYRTPTATGSVFSGFAPKSLRHGCFPKNFTKFFWIVFVQNTIQQPSLWLQSCGKYVDILLCFC